MITQSLSSKHPDEQGPGSPDFLYPAAGDTSGKERSVSETLVDSPGGLCTWNVPSFQPNVQTIILL